MRILFISGEMIAADLAYRLKLEGCDVKLFIDDKSRKDCFDGMVEKTDDWRKELKWVGKTGLIVFDDIGYGATQDDLRARGYLVVGGSERGERLERDREFGQSILAACGIRPLKTYNFSSIGPAINFINHNKKPWVLKQNGHYSALTYAGVEEDGRDTVKVLHDYEKRFGSFIPLSLQEKVSGIEIAAARYFNGNDWVGPIEINIEHKALYEGNTGPQTGEMGTLTWYEEKENMLFEKTLAKLKPYLQMADFRGDIDINCIVNENDIYPLEFTARLGCPAIHVQEAIHNSLWKDFLLAIAKGEEYDLNFKNGFGIVVSAVLPPFPYKPSLKDNYPKGADILFFDGSGDETMENVHFEEVSLRESDGKPTYYVSGRNGYILYATGFGMTVAKAREQAYGVLGKITKPQMFYRSDIGASFTERDERILKISGWI